MPEEAGTFRITFGQKYARHQHPYYGYRCKPDHWVEVRAHSEAEVRDWANRQLGNSWSMLYTPAEWETAKASFPGHVIETVDLTLTRKPWHGART